MANLAGLSGLPYVCTLEKLDKPFQETLEASLVLAPLWKVKTLAARLAAGKASLGGKLGRYLQGASFAFYSYYLPALACHNLPATRKVWPWSVWPH